MNICKLFTLAFIAAMVAACASEQPQPVEPPDNRAADEAAIRNLSKEWAAAAQAKDPAQFASFYTDDASIILEAGYFRARRRFRKHSAK